MAFIEVVIKVPEEEYNIYLSHAQSLENSIRIHKCFSLEHAVIKGTLLNDVKAEMQRRADDPWNMTVGSASQGLMDAIEILDNIGETEKENEE